MSGRRSGESALRVVPVKTRPPPAGRRLAGTWPKGFEPSSPCVSGTSRQKWPRPREGSTGPRLGGNRLWSISQANRGGGRHVCTRRQVH
jgi:hypothetical protein